MTLLAPLPTATPVPPTSERNTRILIVDDNHMIHEDIKKILTPDHGDDELTALEADLFGSAAPSVERVHFHIDSAMQGQEGLALVERAIAAKRPYALAFVDLRMPPGWDGVETIARLWAVDPELQVVICTAYSDYTWAETIERLGRRDNLLILKKPFDVTEVEQLAHALTERWDLVRRTQENLQRVHRIASERGRSLARANEELNNAREEVARAQELLRSAHEREALGRLAVLVSAEISEALAELDQAGVDVTLQRAAARVLTDAAALVAEAPARADVNAMVASAVTYASRHMRVSNLATSFGAVPPVRCTAGDLHHVLVALVVRLADLAERVHIETSCPDDWPRIEITALAAHQIDPGIGFVLARRAVEAAGGSVGAEETPDGWTLIIRLPRSEDRAA